MRALVLREHGSLDKLEFVGDYPKPTIKDDHVIIKVGASSFNYHDVFTVKGMPGIKVPLPVIIGLDNAGNVAYLDRFQADWASTQNKIRNLPKAPMLIDSTGVGDPVVEQLQREGLNVEAFKFTSQSKQEIMLGLQVAIHQERIHYPDGVIKQELEIFEYQYSSHGVKYSAPSGFHDDTVCALALAWRKFDFKAASGRYNFV